MNLNDTPEANDQQAELQAEKENGNGAIDTISEPSARCGSSEVNGLAETMNDFELDSQPTKKLKQSKLTQFFKNKWSV